MKKSKIAKTLYIPVKQGEYLIDSRGAVRMYKSMKSLESALSPIEYDKILHYVENGELEITKKAFLLMCGDTCCIDCPMDYECPLDVWTKNDGQKLKCIQKQAEYYINKAKHE